MFTVMCPRPISSAGQLSNKSLQKFRRAPLSTYQRSGARCFKPSAPIQDWRVKQMVDTVQKYFHLWSNGDSTGRATEDIFALDCVHQDVIWGGGRELVAGQTALKQFVQDTRMAYPDMVIEAVDIATADLSGGGRIFCRWQGQATNLGPYHGEKATGHASTMTGISIFSFSDREHINRVEVWRSPLAEDKHEMEESEQDLHGLHELHLHRLLP